MCHKFDQVSLSLQNDPDPHFVPPELHPYCDEPWRDAVDAAPMFENMSMTPPAPDSRLSTQVRAMEEELDDMQLRLDAKSDEVEHLVETNKDLGDELAAQERTATWRKLRLDAKSAEVEHLVETNKGLRDELHAAQTLLEAQESTANWKKLLEVSGKLYDVRAERDRLQEAISARNDMLADTNTKLEAAVAATEDAQQRVEELKTRLASAYKDSRRLVHKLWDTEDELERAREANQKYPAV